MNYKNIKVINIEKGEGSHDQNPYMGFGHDNTCVICY